MPIGLARLQQLGISDHRRHGAHAAVQQPRLPALQRGRGAEGGREARVPRARGGVERGGGRVDGGPVHSTKQGNAEQYVNVRKFELAQLAVFVWTLEFWSRPKNIRRNLKPGIVLIRSQLLLCLLHEPIQLLQNSLGACMRCCMHEIHGGMQLQNPTFDTDLAQ